MLWGGSTVYTLWGYSPDTQFAVKWKHISNGDWVGVDRGVDEDVYEGSMIFRGPRSELVDLETNVLAIFRDNLTVKCGEGEEIFGPQINYANNLVTTVVNYGKISQVDFKIWTMSLKLRLYDPIFLPVTPSFAKLRLSSWRSQQGSEFDINKTFTYDNYTVFSDHDTEPGIFEGDFTQTTKEMKEIMLYIANTARNNNITFPTLGGITTPFGDREGTGPFTARLIGFKYLGRVNFTDWKIRLKFARVYKL